MNNTSAVLASNIQKYRKKSGFTQEELAEKLGVTFQAVSKWENAKSAPDISFLPILADLFCCSIDELFSRKIKFTKLPFEDDGVMRIVRAQGNQILDFEENSCMEMSFSDLPDKTKIEVLGNVLCNGDIHGDVKASGNVTCKSIIAIANTPQTIECNEIHCDGFIAAGDIAVKEKIVCQNITWANSVTAKSIECESIIKAK